MDYNQVNILDCTLREAGYLNNWEFKQEFSKDGNLLEIGVKACAMVANEYSCIFIPFNFIYILYKSYILNKLPLFPYMFTKLNTLI